MLTISKPLSAGQAQSYHETEYTHDVFGFLQNLTTLAACDGGTTSTSFSHQGAADIDGLEVGGKSSRRDSRVIVRVGTILALIASGEPRRL